MSILNLSVDDKFDDIVASAKTPVLVDFWAPWCGPCRMIAPELEAISSELGEKITVLKVNIDDFPELASNKFKVLGVPTLIMFKDGKEKDRFVGFKPKVVINDFVQKNL